MSVLHGKSQKPLVLFVHGVGGNNTSTWGNFPNLIAADQTLADRADFIFFKYPTAILRNPFDPIAVRIEDVAQAIHSEITSRYKDHTDILLVCHSMGCTVARTYLIETLRAKLPLRVRGILLFAEPAFGSEFARWADYLSIQHWQMRQLRKGSDLLARLDRDWKELVTNGQFIICEVQGGQDGVLPKTKRPPNQFFLADKDHRTLVKPSTHHDGSYVIFRNFVIDALSGTRHDHRTDCLFDVDQPELETFYVERREDFFVQATLSMQNIWLFGRSGVGKTAALMRALSRAGKYRIVSLGHYSGSTVRELYSAIYENILPEGAEPVDVRGLDWPDLVNLVVTGLAQLAQSGVSYILVEEMPLADAEALQEFFSRFCQILSIVAHTLSHERLTFAFSSVADPRAGFAAGGGRIAEMLKVKELFGWGDSYANRLLDVIIANTGLALTQEQKSSVLSEADGSPRFIKLFFRNYLNICALNTELHLSFDEALETTRLEMLQ